MTTLQHPVALRGVVGSTAYGLARPGSDVDRLGVFVAPTTAVLGLRGLTETVCDAGPHQDTDVTYHEFGKYVRLAAVANPTVLELLFLPEDLIEVCTPDGALLREHRAAFLSTSYVRSAYGGYAVQQARKLAARHAKGDDSFSSGTRNRTAKHGRHCLRLLRQGRQLLATGTLTVAVEDPQSYFDLEHLTVPQVLELFEAEHAAFEAQPSVLPERADLATIERVLLTVRGRHFTLAA